MSHEATAFPLSWPPQFPRKQSREAGKFKTTLSAALKNVDSSLRLFARDSGKKLEGLVISSNVTLGAERPADPAVAVWFTWDGLQVCIPVDRYQTVASNLQAIHHIIEARRVELRHGTLALVRASFSGFKALPGTVAGAWRSVLGAGQATTLEEVERCYKVRRAATHPDRPGGDAAEFDRVVKAWEQAKQELSR